MPPEYSFRVAGRIGETDELERVLDACFGVVSGKPVEAREEAEDLAAGEIRVEREIYGT